MSSAPIKMLHDRLLVEVDKEAGERRSAGGQRKMRRGLMRWDAAMA